MLDGRSKDLDKMEELRVSGGSVDGRDVFVCPVCGEEILIPPKGVPYAGIDPRLAHSFRCKGIKKLKLK